MNLRKILSNSGSVIVLALFFGIITGASFHPKESTYLLLGTIMTLSLTRIDPEKVKRTGKKEIAYPVILVYGFSPVMALIPAYFLVSDPQFLRGIVLLAVVPSAVGVVAFSGILKGNTELALAGTSSVYISSLFLTPFMAKSILGAQVDVLSILKSLVLLVVIPLIAARLLALADIDTKMGEWKGDTINLLFFFLIFNIVGANRSAFFIPAYSLFSISVVCFTKTFVAGSIVFFLFMRLGYSYEDSMTYTLFGAFKNGGLAVALSMVLFGPAATIPAAISVVFDFASLTYYQYAFRNRRGKL